MHISSISPNGIVTNLNLAILPAWRLEIIADEKQGVPTGLLGIGIRYVIPPTTTYAFIAAIETKAVGGETFQIAAKGLPRGKKTSDKEVLIESLGMLNNAEGLKTKEIDEIISQAPALVDVYYLILEGLQSGEARAGSFLDYRWQIRPELSGLDCAKIGKTSSEPEKTEELPINEPEDQEADSET